MEPHRHQLLLCLTPMLQLHSQPLPQDMEILQVLVWPHNQQLDMEVKVMDRLGDMLPSPAGDTRGPRCPRPKDTTHTEDKGICF